MGTSGHLGYSNDTYPDTENSSVEVLSATYYDDYRYQAALIWGDGFAFQDVSTADPVADYPTTNFDRVQGLVTGNQVRVLGTDDWMREAVYYDDDYQAIQVMGEHYPIGASRMSMHYDDAGRVTHQLHQHYGYNAFSSGVNLHHRYTYDHAGRTTAVYHRIGNEAEVQLAVNTYNELGELINQDLHQYQDGSHLQSVDYRYNERGWLTSINGVALDASENDLFGLELEYNTGPNPQYNGNISTAQWVNQTKPGGRQGYEYTYDRMDRLAGANYLNVDDPVQDGYDVFGTTTGAPIRYDENGNIRQLVRYGAERVKIDELAYTYGGTVGNQLADVTDGGNDQGFASGEGGMNDDYYYDENGNLTDDYHKGITVSYNHLNLPEQVTFTANGAQIRYTYDASGTRLMKEVEYGSVNERTIYMGGIEYYSPNWQNTPENSSLQLSYITTGYGRAYPYFPLDSDPCATLGQKTTNEGRAWVYHYDLTDHLGNVRTTAASERVTDRYVATMETEVEASEALMFRNLDTRHTDQVRNTTANCGDITNPNEASHLRIASEADQRVFGPAKMLPVQPGDKVRLSVQAQYVPSNANQTLNANLQMLFLSAFTGGGPGAIESGSAAYQGLSEAFGGRVLLGRDDGDVPRAFLRYILFDKDYRAVPNFNDQNSMHVTAAGANAAEALASGEITIDQPGYLYVYVSNESNWATDVFFDDLVIEHEHGIVVQSQDFYPFGLAHQPHARYENKHLYQGKELQHELALNWFDFHARQYDPALGRFMSFDPQNQFASPYVGMGNNPANMVDPDGEFAGLAASMLMGAFVGGFTAHENGGKWWVGAAQGAFQAGVTAGLGALGPTGGGLGALYTAGVGAISGNLATGSPIFSNFGRSTLNRLPGAFFAQGVGNIDEAITYSREHATENVWVNGEIYRLPGVTIFMRGGFRLATPDWWGDTQSILDRNPIKEAVIGAMNQWSSITSNVMLTTASFMAPVPKLGLGRVGSGGITVGSGGNYVSSMNIVREIRHGEKISDLISLAQNRTFSTGAEHAIVRLGPNSAAPGARVLVSGGRHGISFAPGEITTLWGHTHPFVTGASKADFRALKILNQSKQYIFEGFNKTPLVIRP